MSDCAAQVHPYPTRDEIHKQLYLTRCQIERARTYGSLPDTASVKAALDALTRLQADLTPERDD